MILGNRFTFENNVTKIATDDMLNSNQAYSAAMKQFCFIIGVPAQVSKVFVQSISIHIVQLVGCRLDWLNM